MIERPDPVNWSTLKYMAQSPKHYRHALATPREDTEALQLGRLTHAMVYEPAAVAERYCQEPRFHRGMKDDTAREKGYEGGKEAAAAWAAENAAREIVPAELWSRATAIAAALHADPVAGPMIVGGYSEQLIRWTDERTGIECRGRVDHVNGRLSDLKTSRSVDSRWFAAQAVRLGYHAQVAYYADGLAANGIALAEPPALIVVENVAPFDAIVLEFDDATIRAGRSLYRRCLDRLAVCRESDEWPGVADGQRHAFVLPTWAGAEAATLTIGGEELAFD